MEPAITLTTMTATSASIRARVRAKIHLSQKALVRHGKSWPIRLVGQSIKPFTFFFGAIPSHLHRMRFAYAMDVSTFVIVLTVNGGRRVAAKIRRDGFGER